MPYRGLLFAAGTSQRYNGVKQLAVVNQQTLVEHCFGQLMKSDIAAPMLVLAKENEHILSKVAIPMNHVIIAKSSTEGLGASIADAIRHVIEENRALAKIKLPTTSHVVIALGDQINLTADDYRQLYQASIDNPSKIICASSKVGMSPPVIFPQKYFEELAHLSGDEGAKAVLKQHFEQVLPVTVNNAEFDIDTEEDYQSWQQQLAVLS